MNFIKIGIIKSIIGTIKYIILKSSGEKSPMLPTNAANTYR